MPQAIASAIVAAVGIGTSAAAAITVSAFALSVITGVVALGITLGIGLLFNALFGPKRPKPSDGQQTVRQAVGSRVRNYGIVQTGGLLSFFASSGGTLGQVVTLGTGHEAGEIISHLVNDKVVTVDGSGTVTDASFHGAVHIYTRDGDPDQTAIAELTAKFPEWTSAHRQRGCAHAAIIADPVDQDKFSEVYNGQMPQYTQARKGVRVYDPRLDSTRSGGSGSHRLDDPATWEWSDNGALVIADYIAHPDGFGMGTGGVDWDNIAAEAPFAAETVTTVTSETIARWRIWASYKLADDERRQVLADMLTAVDGFCWQGPDLKFRLMVGRYVAPTVTITDDHIKSMAPAFGPDGQKRISAIKMLYTEASIGYREQESAIYAVPDLNEDPNTAPQALQAYYIPHHNQAMRVAKLKAAALGMRWHVQLTLDLYGLNLLGERFCRFESAIIGLSFDCKIDGGPKLDLSNNTVQVTLIEVRESDWDFDAAFEEGTPPATASTTSTVVIGVPAGLTLSAIQIALGEGYAVAIQASWDFDRDGLAYFARYRPVAGGTWIMMTVDNEARTATSGAVSSGIEYEVQLRAMTIGLRGSDWSASETITPDAASSLSAPSGLAATGGTGSASVNFRMPTQPSLAYARLYHSTGTVFSGATQVGSDIVGGLGQVMTITDSGLSAGTEHYWARAFDGSGGSSPLAGPVSATIT